MKAIALQVLADMIDSVEEARACRLIGRERSVIEAGRTMEQWMHDRKAGQRSAKKASQPRTQYKTQHKTLRTHACATTGISN